MLDVTTLFAPEYVSDSFELEGYSFHEAGKKKVAKTKFRNKIAFDVDYDLVTDIMANKGKFYYYMQGKEIVAVYPVRREGGTFSLAERFFSEDVDEKVRAELDKKMTFFVAYFASMTKNGKAVVDGVQLPELGVKTGSYNWMMALAFAMIYGFLFRTTLNSWAGLFVGVAIGIGMGTCFTKRTYYFKSDSETSGKSVDNTDDSVAEPESGTSDSEQV